MEILINDTNILLDLIRLDILDKFFELPFDFRTVDFVVDEINDPHQLETINSYIKSGRLYVKTFSAEELSEIFDLKNNFVGNLSLTDVSVIFYARTINNCRLLTGDKQMRKQAIKLNLKINGILFVFESLIESKILRSGEGIEKLRELQKINHRLPSAEIEELIHKWSIPAK